MSTVGCLVLWTKVVAPRRHQSLMDKAKTQIPNMRARVTQWDNGVGTVQLSRPVAGSDSWAFRCATKLKFGDTVVAVTLGDDHVIEAVPADQPKAE